jgi:hypothetical protein
VNRLDEQVLVRDPKFGSLQGTLVVEVNAADGPSQWTRWEVVTTDGEHYAVLATRHGPHGAVLLESWPLPRWQDAPSELLAACRSADEAKAWLGAHFPPPPRHDPAWRLCDDEEEEPDEPYVTEDGNEYGDYRTVTEAGPRLLPIAELPDDAGDSFDYLVEGLAAKLTQLDPKSYELRAAATWGFSLHDPAGVDVDGGRGYRVVASVRWAGREALLAGEWTEGDAEDRGPNEMTFTLHAPSPPARAEAVALGKSFRGVPIPSFEWLYREENAAREKEEGDREGGQR